MSLEKFKRPSLKDKLYKGEVRTVKEELKAEKKLDKVLEKVVTIKGKK